MALTQAQRDAIYADIILGNLDDYASNPDSLIEVMSSDEFKQGLTCGQLSLEKLNYLFAFTMLSIQKALAESKAYAEGLTTALANALNFCNALSPRAGNLLTVDTQPDGSCKFYYGLTAAQGEYYVDAENGSDSNVGTRASPLRTLHRAVSLVPQGTTNVLIQLRGDQTHYVRSSQRIFSMTAEFGITSYSDTNDAIRTAWNEAGTSWGAYGAASWQRAKIQFIADYAGADSPGTVQALTFETLGGITFYGCHILLPQETNPAPQYLYHAILSGSGLLHFVDTIVENDTGIWNLVGSVNGRNPVVSIDSLLATGTDPLFELRTGGKIEAGIYNHGAGWTSITGLPGFVGTAPATLKTLVVGNHAPTTLSDNYNTTL